MMKYAAAMLTALALAGTGWAIVAATRPMPVAVPAPDMSTKLNQQLKSCDGEVFHLRGLERTLDQVNRFTLSMQSPMAILAVFSSQSQASAKEKQNRPNKPEISLVYVSPDLQKVVINGKLLGPGDMLPGAGRLISIAQDQIVVEQHGHRKVLRLPKPHVFGMTPDSTNTH